MYWLLILFAGIAIGCAGFLYFKKSEVFPKRIRLILFVLRFILVFGILVMFLSPRIKTKEKIIENPICILGVDMSASMKRVWNDKQQEDLSNLFGDAVSDIKKGFKKGGECEMVGFGEFCRTIDLEDNKREFRYELLDQHTDYSNFFSFIRNKFTDRSGAVILLSDGRYNKGVDPLYDYNSIGQPLYTICVGDTVLYPDLYIESWENNPYAYKGTDFPVRVFFGSTNIEKNTKTTAFIDVLHRGKRIHRANVDTCIDRCFVDLYLPATEIGLQSYELVLNTNIEERNTVNNKRLFYIEVLESRSKVLLLSPYNHPDIGAIRRALGISDRYEVEIRIGDDLLKVETIDKDLLSESELVILYGLPSMGYGLDKIAAELREKSLFFVFTPTTDFSALNNFKTGVNLPISPVFEQSKALYNPEFGYFSVENAQNVEALPPLNAVLGLEVKGGSVLLYQKMGNVGSAYPLLWFNKQGDRSLGLLAGEGFWRWRLWDYVQNENTKTTDSYIIQMANLLSVKDNDELLKIKTKAVYDGMSPFDIYASLHNKVGRRITDADIKIDITDASGKIYSYVFEPTVSGDYCLSVGILPQGEYRYKAQCSVSGESYLQKGLFTISDITLEQLDLPANKSVMEYLANRYGGISYYWDGQSRAQLDSIFSDITKDLDSKAYFRPRASVMERELYLSNRVWTLLVLIFIACAEYSLRRYFTDV